MNLVKLQDTKLIHRNLFHTKDQKEIKETIPFTIATKKMKCLGINLPREKKDLYAENYKILMKETKDDTNIMIDIPYWKNQYCENDHTTQNKYDSYQITNGIFS